LALAIGDCDRSKVARDERAATSDSVRARAVVSPATDTAESPATVNVAVVAPQEDPESGIVERGFESGPPGPHLRGGVLYAESQAVLRAIGANARVTLVNGDALVDGRKVGVAAHQHDNAVYVELKPFARHFRAFTKLESNGRWARVFPENALRYLRDNREHPDQVPILQEARAEGLWPRP
jgi:hypothetical protein